MLFVHDFEAFEWQNRQLHHETILAASRALKNLKKRIRQVFLLRLERYRNASVFQSSFDFFPSR